MAIDTAEKRRTAAGVGVLLLGPNITPNSDKDDEWRSQVASSYFFAAVAVAAEEAPPPRHEAIRRERTPAIDITIAHHVYPLPVIGYLRAEATIDIEYAEGGEIGAWLELAGISGREYPLDTLLSITTSLSGGLERETEMEVARLERRIDSVRRAIGEETEVEISRRVMAMWRSIEDEMLLMGLDSTKSRG